ncbi:retrovirus-related Pol polyprotein from transposon 297 [Trichonephila clavipes]|uniref:Retrovirus-related Pol polyprotein from transposon 297 n=1 Tax=Trichonephila clavipes TaxID=2585209 RepID=A0A8X7BKF9_TRICX|nr:retrovirus-related Pol polyprotein from transposon 297 [Trichonephila clavipes]
MPFGLSGVAPTFQKAIDIILKPMVGMFVNVYMDNVIISSPSFTQHVEHLKEVFRLLHEAGLTLNKEKCKFGCDELKYFGLIINKEGVKTDETKVQAIVEMKPPGNSKERGRHNREDQFDPEKAEEGTTTPTSKREQDQTIGMPDEEVINNGRTRKEKKRVRECHYP